MASVLSTGTSAPGEATYLIAQYMDDVFRREVRNVGVIVKKAERLSARFLGEVDGRIDGRKLGAFHHPDVYRQWVSYWRRTMATDPDAFTTLRSTSRANFLVIDGGLAADTGDDGADAIAAYLYGVLVSESGWDTPLNASDASDATAAATVAIPKLHTDIANTFRQVNILATATDQPSLVTHPVRLGEQVKGKTRLPHEPQFTQANGRLWVMETLDFLGPRRRNAKDHAGFTAFMFADLKDALGSGVETIAIYRAPTDPIAEERDAIAYALAMLEKTQSPVVDWTDPVARTTFVEERRRIAMA